jgi:hypothetical protein
MPNPKTIEELLKMKPCPFEDGQMITTEQFCFARDNGLLDYALYQLAYNKVMGAFRQETPFKMPDGYFHLPIGMKLGLPLGEWEVEDLYPLVNVLPFDVLKQYLARTGIAVNYYGGSLEANDLTNYKRIINILKQPPNLYNPLDHKEEVLMGNNSASEKQPAKETKTMKLPWQDISTLEAYYGKSGVMVWKKPNKTWYVYGNKDELLSSYFYKSGSITHWLPITLPGAPTVEAPIEPERVSVQDFLNKPEGKWVTYNGTTYSHFYQSHGNVETRLEHMEDLVHIAKTEHPIYATNPTAWLAWKAEQGGISR